MASATATVAQAGQVPWQQRRSVRAGYVLILLGLVACAFTDSFVALAELARATGALPGHRAITLPLMLDGLTLAGTLFAVTRFGPGQGNPAYGYALIAIGSLASLAGNVAHAPDTLGARVIAGAPPVILFLVFEAAAISFRRRPTASAAALSADPRSIGADQAPDPPDSAPTSAEGGSVGADEPTKRQRAQRIYADLASEGTRITGVQLAAAAGLSPSYARSLVAEFHTQPPEPAQHNGHQPPVEPAAVEQKATP